MKGQTAWTIKARILSKRIIKYDPEFHKTQRSKASQEAIAIT